MNDDEIIAEARAEVAEREAGPYGIGWEFFVIKTLLKRIDELEARKADNGS